MAVGLDIHWVKAALIHHLQDLCFTLNSKDIADLLFEEGKLNRVEFDKITGDMEPLKPTGQAKFLLEFLINQNKEIQLRGLLDIIQREYGDIHDTLCETVNRIKDGELEVQVEENIEEWPSESELTFEATAESYCPISNDDLCAVLIKSCPFDFITMRKSDGLGNEDERIKNIWLQYPKAVICMLKKLPRSFEMGRIQCELKVHPNTEHTITVDNVNHLTQNNNIGNNKVFAVIGKKFDGPVHKEAILADKSMPPEWTLIHGNKLVQPPKDSQKKKAVQTREADGLTAVQMCNPLVEKNLERVLTTLSQNTFTLLLDELSPNYVLEKALCNEIQSTGNQVEQVRNLVGHLRNCTERQYKNFIELMQVKEETFALGCYMGLMYSFCCGENDLECQAAGGTLQEPTLIQIEEKNTKQNLGVIDRNLTAFSKDVTKSEVTKAEEKCIELEIKVEDSSELEHLKIDVESGVFFKRYTAWMKKYGGTVAEGETMEFKVIHCGEVVASYENVPSPNAAGQTENGIRRKQIKLPKVTKLTSFHKKVMKHRLETHREETAQAVALHNRTNNIRKFIDIQKEESVLNLLTRLQQQDVLSSVEVTQLEVVLQNKDTDVFVSDLVCCLSRKTFEEVFKFVDVLSETHITVELGSHLKDVLKYCKQVSEDVLKLEEQHDVVKELRRDNQSLRKQNQKLRSETESLTGCSRAIESSETNMDTSSSPLLRPRVPTEGVGMPMENEIYPSMNSSKGTGTTYSCMASYPQLRSQGSCGHFVKVPAPFRQPLNISVAADEETKISVERLPDCENYEQFLNKMYDARNNEERQGLLNSIDPETLIKYVFQNVLRLQKYPKYLVSLVLISAYTSYSEVRLSALTFLLKLLPSIQNLNINTIGEVKHMYSHLTSFHRVEQQGCRIDLEAVLMVLQCCRYCAQFLLVHAISQEDSSTEMSSLLTQLQSNLTMIDTWDRKGVFGKSDFHIITQVDTIREIEAKIKQWLQMSPGDKAKFVAIDEKLTNFRMENKSFLMSVLNLNCASVTEKVAILVCVCSLVSSKKEQRFQELLLIILKELKKRVKKDHELVVILETVEVMAEKIENQDAIVTTVEMVLSMCKKFFNREYCEKYVLPMVCPLLYHKLPEVRRYIAGKLLPCEEKSRNPTKFQMKAVNRLEELNRMCIESDLIYYRVKITASHERLPEYMGDCNIYDGTFGNAKTGVEVICSKQSSIDEIVHSTYGKIGERISFLEKLQTTKEAGRTFGCRDNIINLLAFMRPGNGISYYLIKTGIESQCLSTYLQQKILHQPPKHIAYSKRLKYAQDLLSAVLHCNNCGIILINITASSFIICKENHQRIVKLYDLELAKSRLNENDITVDDQVPTMWLAPESVYNMQYNNSTETYSTAHTVLEVLSYGVYPYQEMGQIEASRKIQMVLKYRLLPERRSCVQEALYIGLLSCLMKDPKQRTTLDGIHHLLHYPIGQGDRDHGMNVDNTNMIREMLRRQPRQPERGIPRKLHVRSAEEIVIDDMEKCYDDYLMNRTFSKQFTCVVQDSEFITHDQPIQDPKNPEQIRLCIVKKSSTKEERNKIQEISHRGKFLANIGRFWSEGGCKLHKTVTLKIGRKEPLLNLMTEREFRPDERREIYKQIAEGMSYLHDQGVIHCSLQGKNVYASERPISVVIGQLNRATQLKMDVHDTHITEAVAQPFDSIPGDIMRWCPLETLETKGQMSVYSDVAQYGHMVWELETANGRGSSTPKRYFAPYPHVPVEKLADAHRQKHMLPQPRGCPDWLDRLIKVCICNPKCMRPLFDEIVPILGSSNPEKSEVLYPKDATQSNKRSIIDGIPFNRNKRRRSEIAIAVSGAYHFEGDDFFQRGTIPTRNDCVSSVEVKNTTDEKPAIRQRIMSLLKPDKKHATSGGRVSNEVDGYMVAASNDPLTPDSEFDSCSLYNSVYEEPIQNNNNTNNYKPHIAQQLRMGVMNFEANKKQASQTGESSSRTVTENVSVQQKLYPFQNQEYAEIAVSVSGRQADQFESHNAGCSDSENYEEFP